ncbi:mechanosensitive ion channel-like protein [Glaciihabitans tibetensis]|uniref:Mechanosensitive ion channel-like protein n=1 Tax=Glaciihabitans tibetensis TaxID=1266600 RepID=A0A2T0VDA9_9MICO|nr:mechanosensitive ion channel domain-containing protein [Glaciihabitans tibetensis]PRY68125.1 mechanosensitive ion channel-like protein [Glaciihabitans tibetensis]
MFDDFVWKSWIGLPIAVVIALVVTLVALAILSVAMRAAAKRKDWPKALASGARHPFRLLVANLAVWIAVALTLPNPDMADEVNHVFRIITIALATWLGAGLLSFFVGIGLSRYRTDTADNKVARRMHTQLAIVRRLGIAVIVIIGIAAILLTFPGVQALGASLLASAGLLSIVAGLAAQSTLANVFAGVQLVFSEAIRVDDVVIAEKEWGRIEEITLTYVVVHIWDDRRLVLPSTYFTTTPFENWTRNSSELLGSIELDLDWRVSPAAMRQHLEVVLDNTEIWDGRASVLQVTDAVGGFVRIRILVTAVDAPTLFDLRCYVREEMVEWVHSQDPAGMPRARVEMVAEAVRAQPREMEKTHTDQIGLFTGTADAEERASLFTSAIPIIRPGDTASERNDSSLGLPVESEFETADELPDGQRPSRY